MRISCQRQPQPTLLSSSGKADMTPEQIAERIEHLSKSVWAEFVRLSAAAQKTDYDTDGEWPVSDRVRDAIAELEYADEHLSAALTYLSPDEDTD